MELIKSEFSLRGVIESRIGGRDENQDSCGYKDTPIGTAVVVCDGMGGMQGGKYASMIAVDTIINYLMNQTAPCDTAAVLQEAIQQANATIIQVGMENPHLYGMGTTVTALILDKHCATIAYVGDSRVYQLRNKKKVFRTFDHSMVFEMVKGGVMSEEEARCSGQSNVILRALGIGPEVKADIYKVPYLEGDRFILCSDGFWGAMPEKEFLSYMTKSENLGYIVENLANRVDSIGRATGGMHDNLTAAVLDVKCNSKMKVKMSKKVKVILLVLIVLLSVSLALNAYTIYKYCSKKVDNTEQTLSDENPNSNEDNAPKTDAEKKIKK